jgi:hypothetical protein
VAQRLHHLEDDGVPKRDVGRIQLACVHDALGQRSRGQLRAILKLQSTQIGDLALSEEPVAHDVASTPLLDVREQAQCGVYVRKIVLGLFDLRFIGVIRP